MVTSGNGRNSAVAWGPNLTGRAVVLGILSLEQK